MSSLEIGGALKFCTMVGLVSAYEPDFSWIFPGTGSKMAALGLNFVTKTGDQLQRHLWEIFEPQVARVFYEPLRML